MGLSSPWPRPLMARLLSCLQCVLLCTPKLVSPVICWLYGCLFFLQRSSAWVHLFSCCSIPVSASLCLFVSVCLSICLSLSVPLSLWLSPPLTQTASIGGHRRRRPECLCENGRAIVYYLDQHPVPHLLR